MISNPFLNFIQKDCSNIQLLNPNGIKHVSDDSAYYIFDASNLFIKVIIIGQKLICEIPEEYSWKNIKSNNIFLYTGTKEWFWLKDPTENIVEIKGNIRHVWISDIYSFENVLEQSSFKEVFNYEGLLHFKSIDTTLKKIKQLYARCKNSMLMFDEIHRNYIAKRKFKENEIIAIKSVAGSGKTTTLLNLAKKHNTKRILYIAFNKSLITEIKDKLRTQQISNMYPKTFDALLYSLFISIYGKEPNIIDIKPNNIQDYHPWLQDKPYKLKEYYCKSLSKFCNDANINDISEFCMEKYGKKQPILENLWDKVTYNSITTFETIRKQAYINQWFNRYIDQEYDMIMIDETQDFDMIMLKMLLNDTLIPKVFVGDPMQSIYQFRGCINAFNYLPSDSLIIEFYSTFRVGNPACDTIRDKFHECWMISRAKNETIFVNSFSENEKYTYLFRSWRVLLQTATSLPNIWIYNFNKKYNEIINLHKKLQYIKTLNEEECEDDLPMFLKSLSAEELQELLDKVSDNIVDEDNCQIKFYTIHSYKGMENDNIRIAKDVDIKKDTNIYYVAVTRGMKKICIDPPEKTTIPKRSNNKQAITINKLSDFVTPCGHSVKIFPKTANTSEIQISGPYVFEKNGYKSIYCKSNIDLIQSTVTKYLNSV